MQRLRIIGIKVVIDSGLADDSDSPICPIMQERNYYRINICCVNTTTEDVHICPYFEGTDKNLILKCSHPHWQVGTPNI
jgi:hypothetical protein